MREELLSFIWRYRHFNQQGLVSENGLPVQVISPGEQNRDQGPDFRNAQLRIGDRDYTGAVELHVRTSDWIRHAHDGDVHYRNVCLHVVWENDRAEPPGNIPVLALRDRVSKLLLGRYEYWMQLPGFVPCEPQLAVVGPEIWKEWLRTLTIRRLERRAGTVRGWLEQNRLNWEETTWWGMARSMGLPVNAAVFEAVARTLPLRLLRRHRMQATTLETLLMGQAGLLEEGSGAWREYRFWQAKYGLMPVAQPVSFLRMRPAHAPALRLIQLAGLLQEGRGWFALIREAESVEDVLQALTGPKGLGAEMRLGIVINAFVPLLYAQGQKEKAMRWLETLKAERNALLRGWARLGVEAANAAEAQGLLELKKEYCNARRCLECAIGRAVLAA
jgi:hypothetical protein